MSLYGFWRAYYRLKKRVFGVTGDHTPQHLSGYQPVYVAVSDELLREMESGWTQPVQVHIERDNHEPYGWRMTFRRITDAKYEGGFWFVKGSKP